MKIVALGKIENVVAKAPSLDADWWGVGGSIFVKHGPKHLLLA